MLVLLALFQSIPLKEHDIGLVSCSSSYNIFSNDVFCMKFDVMTPRNHLIILAKKNAESVKNFNDTELHSLLNLVDDFINKVNGTQDDIILSFHIGNLVS